MDRPRFLVYGATGYTARLILDVAKARGHTPIIAGRHPQKMLDLARETGLEARVIDLGKPREIAPKLAGVTAVLNCAGPFSRTMAPMLAACIEARVHYLDITGEIQVFEKVFAQTRALKDAGITAIPGVGFDVVPSDCLAAMLARRLPDARAIDLAIDARRGGISPGTAKTALEGAGLGGCVRENGKLVGTPTLGRQLEVPFPSGAAPAWTVPWGDVSTAFHSTGIGDVRVFMALPRATVRAMRLARRLGWLLRLGFVRRLLERRIDRAVKGPSAEARQRTRTELWGRVVNAREEWKELALRTPEGYSLTADAAVRAVERVLAGGVPTGAQTPSTAFGAEFVLELPGVELVEQP